jgi:hypothetical protein
MQVGLDPPVETWYEEPEGVVDLNSKHIFKLTLTCNFDR